MEFGVEGAELEEVSKLPSEEAEVSEQPLDGVVLEPRQRLVFKAKTLQP